MLKRPNYRRAEITDPVTGGASSILKLVLDYHVGIAKIFCSSHMSCGCVQCRYFAVGQTSLKKAFLRLSLRFRKASAILLCSLRSVNDQMYVQASARWLEALAKVFTMHRNCMAAVSALASSRQMQRVASKLQAGCVDTHRGFLLL